jgi:hypothetical protein
MHLRLNPLDEKRYAQITETRFVFPASGLFAMCAKWEADMSLFDLNVEPAKRGLR